MKKILLFLFVIISQGISSVNGASAKKDLNRLGKDDPRLVFSQGPVKGMMYGYQVRPSDIGRVPIDLKALEDMFFQELSDRRVEVVKHLLRNGVRLNENIYMGRGDMSYKPPLFIAVESEYEEVFDELLNNPKIEINKCAISCIDVKITPLYRAVTLQKASKVKKLLEHLDINGAPDVDVERRPTWSTPLEAACSCQNLEIAYMLVSHGANRKGCENMYKYLLENEEKRKKGFWSFLSDVVNNKPLRATFSDYLPNQEDVRPTPLIDKKRIGKE